MTIQNAKWELQILTNKKYEMKSVGRELDYDDENRIKKLREFIDSQDFQSQNTEKIENKPEPEFPF